MTQKIQPMRQKMQHSMVFVLTATLVIAYIFLTGIMYRQTVTTVEEEIHREADYISKAVQISGTEYLNQMDEVRANTRITWISTEGTVLYDSTEDEHTFENHKNRPEVKKALAKGEGEDIRKSDTIGEEMCYYAEKMPDGTVLRVSKTMNSAMKSAFHILPFMIFLALVMIVTAWLLSKWQIERLIRPINTLDLENPLEQEMYPELQPLLERIEQSNKEKEAVAAMRREFSANVSHELKTPLTSISGYAEIMKDGLVRLLKRESLTHGINVAIKDNALSIDFHVIVAYGVSISTVADNLIESVKYKVEEFTGMKVEKISIYVEGVRVID